MIVVVDDHADSADALVRLFHKAGLEAVHKSCARDLLAFLADVSPSLIVLDVMLPDMGGMDCLRAIRRQSQWQKIPIIMYSADFSYERMKESQRTGAQEYVVKGTMKWDDFLNVVKKYVKME